MKLIELICITLTMSAQKWEFDSNMIKKLYYSKKHSDKRDSDSDVVVNDLDELKTHLTDKVSNLRQINLDRKRNTFLRWF